MNDAYNAYIKSCKAPKKPSVVKNIVRWILVGIRKGYDTQLIADKLNEHRIKTLQNKTWTYNSLQMQILKMARLDRDSSLAWALATMIEEGSAYEHDLVLLADRTK